MGQIRAAYPQSRHEFGDETIALWLSRFENVPDEPFRAAVAAHIDHSAFPPTIADIRKRLQAGAVDGGAAERSWSNLLASLARWTPGAPWDHPIDGPTRAGLDAVGGARRLIGIDADDAVFVRKEFVAAYEATQRDAADVRLGLSSGNGAKLLSPEVHDADRA